MGDAEEDLDELAMGWPKSDDRVNVKKVYEYHFNEWKLQANKLLMQNGLRRMVPRHRGFLEHWNSQKSVSNIWQCFSYLLDEGIPKIWKQLNSHDGFLSYLQNSTANSAHLAAHFCPALDCPQKATGKMQFLSYFWNLLIK